MEELALQTSRYHTDFNANAFSSSLATGAKTSVSHFETTDNFDIFLFNVVGLVQ